MCLTAPARLLSIDDAADSSAGIVDVDGLRRRASLVLVPEARPGDWLLVGAGTALRTLDAAEAREITDLIAAATTATAARYPTGGRP